MSADDLLYVEDFVTVRQSVTMASVSFDDEAVADFFEAQVDAGKKPEQFARTWLHTHPGNSPQPSSTDEETFQRVFGSCQWALMFVLAQGGKSYARMMCNVGPGVTAVIPAEVDYLRAFGPSSHADWETEYKANIQSDSFVLSPLESLAQTHIFQGNGLCCPDNFLEELEAMEPAERRLVLDELAARPDLWGGNEVVYDY